MVIKFGTGGFRAIIGDEFTKNNTLEEIFKFRQSLKDLNISNVEITSPLASLRAFLR